MKSHIQLFNIIFITFLTLVSFDVCAQRGILKAADATVGVNDTVVLRLEEYVGESVNWQYSLDAHNWTDISGATADTLLFEADHTTFFRASVIAGDCDPFYSDTVLVIVHYQAEVATSPVSNITYFSATSGGEVINDGGAVEVSRGVVWSTSQNPTMDDNDGVTMDGSGVGEFTSQLKELVPGTTYFVRAYAVNAAGPVYGYQYSFTTPALQLADVVTADITDITENSAMGGGEVTYDGGSEVTARGVVWSTFPNPTIDNYEGFTIDGGGIGSFTSNIVGLNPGVAYYVRAYATNDIGTAYGNQHTFTTLGQVPTVLTEQATEVTTDSAVLNASVNPNQLETTVIFEWGLTDEYGNEITAEQSPIEESTSVSVSALIDGLESGTTYHFRVVAENNLGVSYGEERQFKTYDGTVTDIDENLYYTIIIGNQEWMAENLRVTRGAAGNDITRLCYNDNDTNCELYGGLYTWHTATNGQSSSSNPSGVQGICPDGWHIPSDAEWTELVNYVVSQGYPNSADDPNGAGNALKSCRQVGSPLDDCNTSTHPRWSSHQTLYGFDEFGFSALPGGGHFGTAGFSNRGLVGAWWSTSVYSSIHVWNRRINHSNSRITRYYSRRHLGYSLRCVRDLD